MVKQCLVLILFVLETPRGRTAINLKPKHNKVGERAPEELRRTVEPNPYLTGISFRTWYYWYKEYKGY